MFRNFGRKLHGGNADTLNVILSFPMLVESKDKDLAKGAVQKMYELHKDSNQNIREK